MRYFRVFRSEYTYDRHWSSQPWSRINANQRYSRHFLRSFAMVTTGIKGSSNIRRTAPVIFAAMPPEGREAVRCGLFFFGDAGETIQRAILADSDGAHIVGPPAIGEVDSPGDQVQVVRRVLEASTGNPAGSALVRTVPRPYRPEGALTLVAKGGLQWTVRIQ